MRTNVATAVEPVKTHEGATASRINAYQQLRRSVLATMLWEDSFYEDGQSIAERIAAGVKACQPEKVAALAIDARSKFKLRHIPLFIVREMARHESHRRRVAETLAEVIQRPDELGEFLSLYWKEGRCPLAAQVKKGLAKALAKFNEYSLAKYNQANAIKLRDVLFLTHVKPKDAEQTALWKRLVDGTLATPDTWEVELSASKDKKSSWERLLNEGKLGALAMLRNLRNMVQAEVSLDLIREGLRTVKTERVLPFRFITAATHAPKLEPDLDELMLRCMAGQEKLTGKTVVVIDVSGSMYGGKVSEKSEIDRAQAACALAALVREVSETSAIYATAGSDYTRIHQTKEVPARRGMALIAAIHGMCEPLGGGGIFLKQVMDYVYAQEKSADRIVVITDEQDCGISSADNPEKANAFGVRNYILNVGTYKNGIAYGKWTHITGFSEAVLDFIRESERDPQ